MSVKAISLAAEFPNDNPALHRGVIWVCLGLTGRWSAEAPATPPPAVPEVPDPEPVVIRLEEPQTLPLSIACVSAEPAEPEDEDVASIVVEELEPIEASVEGEVEGEFPSDAVFASLVVSSLDEVTVSEPARCDSSALPPAPDDPFTLLVCMLADVAIGAGCPHIAALLPGLLYDGRVPADLDPASASALRAAGLWDGEEIAPAFVATTSAWRAILRGTSDDFSACGAAMLDEWSADLLGKLLAHASSSSMLRQELRSRGVAAFGLIEASA